MIHLVGGPGLLSRRTVLCVLLAGLLVLLLWHSLVTSSSSSPPLSSSWTSTVSSSPTSQPQEDTGQHAGGPAELKAEVEAEAPLHDASPYEQQPQTAPVKQDTSWRAHLEVAHAAPDASQQPNLGFSHIYAIASHADPAIKQRMDLLAQSLAMSLVDWIDPVSPLDPSIPWIAQQVKRVRLAKRRSLVKAARQPPNMLGGLKAGSPWLQPSVELKEVEFPLFARSHAWYRAHRISPALGSVALPSEIGNEVDGSDWVQYLLQHPSLARTEEEEDVDVEALLRDPRESWSELQLSRDSIAEWATHTQLWRSMLERQDEVALVLSDTVDLEFDVERLWSQVRRHLPVSPEGQPEWHMLLLGHHSQAEQSSKPPPPGAIIPPARVSIMLTRSATCSRPSLPSSPPAPRSRPARPSRLRHLLHGRSRAAQTRRRSLDSPPDPP